MRVMFSGSDAPAAGVETEEGATETPLTDLAGFEDRATGMRLPIIIIIKNMNERDVCR